MNITRRNTKYAIYGEADELRTLIDTARQTLEEQARRRPRSTAAPMLNAQVVRLAQLLAELETATATPVQE